MKNTTLMIHPEKTRISRLVGSWLREYKTTHESKAATSGREFVPINRDIDEQLNRKNIEEILSRSNPSKVDILVYYGHGTRCSLSMKGDNFKKPKTKDCDECNECKKLPTERVLIDTESLDFLDGKEIFAIACKSALKLGDDITDFCKNDTAFFGFDDRLDVPDYLDDKIKNRFKCIVNKALELLHSHSKFGSKIERYRVVAATILTEFDNLANDMRLANQQRTLLGDEAYAVQWRINFKPACKIDGIKYTIENIFLD